MYDLYNAQSPGTALELKVGYQSATKAILEQIGFDIALLNANGKGFTNTKGANPGIGGVIFTSNGYGCRGKMAL